MELTQAYYSRVDESFNIGQVRNTQCNMVYQHYHDAYEIYYLLDGERNYFIKNRTYAMKKGDLVFININELHRTMNANLLDHERILINFKREFIDGMLPAGGIDLFGCFTRACNAVKLGVNEQITVESLLHRMINEENKRGYAYELYLKTMLIDLLVMINRHILQNPRDEFDHPDPQHIRVLEIVNHINANYADPLTLGGLSRTYFFSPCYLSRIFKQVTGFNFIEYVNNVRIMESRKLLKETTLSVTQISGKVGYESTTQFGRVFKAITGQSPLSYRKDLNA